MTSDKAAAIQRYGFEQCHGVGSTPEFGEREDGRYVLYTDHAAALQAARDEVERLRSELQCIAEIDPRDSSNGFNEWGEAECFRVAQERAKHALAPAKKVD